MADKALKDLSPVFEELYSRVVRDIWRKIATRQDLQPVFHAELAKAERLLTQQRQDKNKLYSLHAPDVERISKGKADKKDEFGVKVSVAGMLAEPGNPHDGHALGRIIEQVERMTNCAVQRSFVDGVVVTSCRSLRYCSPAASGVEITGRRLGRRHQCPALWSGAQYPPDPQ